MAEMTSKDSDSPDKNVTTLNGGHDDKNGRHGTEITKASSVQSEQYDTICCSCFYRDVEKGEESVKPKQEKVEEEDRNTGCQGDLRGFFHSVPYYSFVLFATLAVVILLIAELFIDVLSAKDGTSDGYAKELSSISVALHFFSLAIISLFFLEAIIRILVWRSLIVYKYIMVFDVVVITVSFIVMVILTVALSSSSVYDSCALIISLRLVHVYSIATICKRRSKLKSMATHNEIRTELQTTQAELQRVYREIADKNFEIKQLHAHLGNHSGVNDKEVSEAWLKAKGESVEGATASGRSEDAEMKKAIELSKMEFEKETNESFTNSAYLPLDRSDADTDDGYCSVIVHHSRNSFKGSVTNLDDNITPTKIKNENSSLNNENLEDFSLKLLNANNNNNNVLNTGNGGNLMDGRYSSTPSSRSNNVSPATKTPIKVCIDPEILNCDNLPSTDGEINETSFSDFSQDKKVQSISTISSSSTETGFGEDESRPDLVKTGSPRVKHLPLDQGYHSEDISGRMSASSSLSRDYSSGKIIEPYKGIIKKSSP